jgi:hypothetical protein
MKKRNIILIALIIVVVIVVGVVYFVLRGASPSITSTNTTGNLPPVATPSSTVLDNGTSSFPTGSTFQIGTPQGVITVNNFYKTMAYITTDNENVVLAETDDYNVDYVRAGSSFIIALTAVTSSLQDVRNAAEAAFMGQLGVSESDACKLNVDEGVTDKTSQYYGDSLGLSFCSSTVPVTQ